MTFYAFTKDPNAVLDYAIDLRPATHGSTTETDWLQADEIVQTHTVTASPSGLTVDSSAEADGIITAWLSGGTADTDYTVTYHFTTSQGRADDRSITIMCRQR